MAETMGLARSLAVAVGAHPGSADREFFGRRELAMAPAEIEALVGQQLRDLAQYGEFRYVKPHGALYNMAGRDPSVAEAIARAVRAHDDRLALMGLAGSALLEVGRAHGLTVVSEGFADRGYDDEGRLLSRNAPGALLERTDEVESQVLSMVLDGRVRSRSGLWVPVQADSICVHGDGPHAVDFVKRLRSVLESAGVNVRAFRR